MRFWAGSSLMNPQLAALLKAYAAFREAAPDEAGGLGDDYESKLRDYSKRFNVGLEQLDSAVKIRYLRELRSEEKRHTALPPRA